MSDNNISTTRSVVRPLCDGRASCRSSVAERLRNSSCH